MQNITITNILLEIKILISKVSLANKKKRKRINDKNSTSDKKQINKTYFKTFYKKKLYKCTGIFKTRKFLTVKHYLNTNSGLKRTHEKRTA